MARLGDKQARFLRDFVAARAVVVPDDLIRSLIRRGLLTADVDGSFAHISPAGLRAVADLAEHGRVKLFVKPERKEAKRDGE